jgi:hypothetical protein
MSFLLFGNLVYLFIVSPHCHKQTWVLFKELPLFHLEVIPRRLHQRAPALASRCCKLTDPLTEVRRSPSPLKGPGLLERDGTRYAYGLTPKGAQVALLFLFFHERLCSPLANSRFHHQPDLAHCQDTKPEGAYHKADKAIQNIVDLLAAA